MNIYVLVHSVEEELMIICDVDITLIIMMQLNFFMLSLYSSLSIHIKI